MIENVTANAFRKQTPNVWLGQRGIGFLALTVCRIQKAHALGNMPCQSSHHQFNHYVHPLKKHVC